MAYLKCLRNVSAAAPVVSVNLYSAAVDTVTFTDASGARSVTTDTDGHASVEINIAPGGSLITFTSSIAKDPSNLSNAYTKTITITTSTTTVKVMPENSLYWWGYISDEIEEVSAANGWTAPSGRTLASPTFSTNKIELSSSTNQYCRISTIDKMSSGLTFNVIVKGITPYNNKYGNVDGVVDKNFSGTITTLSSLTSDTLTKLSAENTVNDNYIMFGSDVGRASEMYAFWKS